jgi:triosephosphate isomerase (TIM)
VSWTERLMGRGQRAATGSESPPAGRDSARKPLIAGNWKMNHTHLDAINVVQKLAYRLDDADYDAVDVSLHPAFTALRTVQTLLDADRIPMALGAQDVHWEQKGAFTGEVSPIMLAKLNVRYVIVGHSERRRLFGETDETTRAKTRAVLDAGMTPIVCVGETFAQREAGETEAHVAGQVRAALAGLSAEPVAGLVVAYEPLWAIGTGESATPEDAQATCALIRSTVAAEVDPESATGIRILYGGSVDAANTAALIGMPDVDGALVGGASLDAELFAAVIHAARETVSGRGVR